MGIYAEIDVCSGLSSRLLGKSAERDLSDLSIIPGNGMISHIYDKRYGRLIVFQCEV